jgi:hypothetical protein
MRLVTCGSSGCQADDGTAEDALREGLHLLGGAGLDARNDAAVLLPALYVGLVAGEYEELSQAGDRRWRGRWGWARTLR